MNRPWLTLMMNTFNNCTATESIARRTSIALTEMLSLDFAGQCKTFVHYLVQRSLFKQNPRKGDGFGARTTQRMEPVDAYSKEYDYRSSSQLGVLSVISANQRLQDLGVTTVTVD